MVERAELSDRHAFEQVALIEAELDVLQDLEVPPTENVPSLRRVSQSRRYPVWRVAHPFVEGAAIRLIVWFPPERQGEVVIVLFGADKAQMGDVFYNSVGPRADAAIDSYLHSEATEAQSDE